MTVISITCSQQDLRKPALYFMIYVMSTVLQLLLVLVICFNPGKGLKIYQIIPDVIAGFSSSIKSGERGCPLHGRHGVIEWCMLPNGVKTTLLNDDVNSVPHTSKCAFGSDSWLYLKTCKGCYNGIWRKTDCNQELYHPRTRVKRGWFGKVFRFVVGGIGGLIGNLICIFFCSGGGGGTGGGGEVHRPPTITCHTPTSRTFAASGQTSAVVSWTTPTGKDGKGKTLTPKLVSGLGNTGTNFPRGYHTISYSVTDSMGFKDYCFFTFEVSVHTCVPVPWPRNGRKDCERTEMIFGKSCTVSCDRGYELKGSSVLTCQSNGNYGSGFPTCEAKICPPLTAPTNGNPYQCTDESRYRSLCFTSCVDGFRPAKSPFTTCLSSGTWLLPFPECKDDQPPMFDNCPVNSIIAYADSGLTSTTVTYGTLTASDNSGSVTTRLVQGLPSGSVFDQGSQTLQYVAEDDAGNQVYCFFAISVRVLSCSVPNYEDDNMAIACPDGFKLGSECSIGCRSGLPLVGPNKITCESDNSDPPQTSWDFSITTKPFCKALPCPDLTPPENGAIACDSTGSGSHCSMMCNSKFDIPRTVTATQLFICGWTTGTWAPTNNVPDCTETRRPGKMLLPSEFYYYNGDCSAVSTQDQIKSNFRTILENSLVGGQLCPQGCAVIGVDIKCGASSGRRKRRAETRGSLSDSNFDEDLHSLVKREAVPLIITFAIEIPFDLNGTTPADARTSHEARLNTIGESIKTGASTGLYDTVVPGFNLRSDSVQFDWVDFSCPEGQVGDYKSVSCRGCPKGMMYDSTTSNCTYCSKGSYQDEDFALSCKSCSIGSSTIKEGAKNESFCISICPAGESSPTGLEPCSSCPIGSYQDIKGSTDCKKCPLETSSNSGSTQLIDCQAYDLILRGSASLTSTQLKSDIGDFSFTSWLKQATKSNSESSIAFQHNGIRFAIKLSKTLAISILGSTEITDVSIGKEWVYLVVTWQQSTKQLKVYIGGQHKHTVTVSTVSSNIIVENSTLDIQISDGSELQLRSIKLRNVILSEANITEMASSCDSTSLQTILSRNDLKPENKSFISLVIPSACDAFDDCVSSPCGNHSCINQPNGFRCQCSGGYTGTTCNIPPDYCASNGCQNEATCTSSLQDTSFTCTCADGYKGRLCDIEIVDGNWGNWTEWGECSVTCGGGSQKRIRSCDNPSPDEDGKPCEGNNTDVRSCNNNDCPECKSFDLQRAYGTSYSCNGNTSSLTCEITCREGTFYTNDEPTSYNCSAGNWLPGTKILPCKTIISANGLQLSGAATFPSIDCSDKTSVDMMKSQFLNKIQQETCPGSEKCDYKVGVSDCSGNRKRRQTGTTLTSIISVDILPGDLDLTAYQYNETISPQLIEVVEAIQLLEQAGQILENETDRFSVTINGVTHTISSVTVTGQTLCSAGSVGDSGLCVECPQGTFSNGQECVYCSQGYYQHQAGQSGCLECPPGWKTEFIGSIDNTMCSVPSNVVSTPIVSLYSSTSQPFIRISTTQLTTTKANSVSNTPKPKPSIKPVDGNGGGDDTHIVITSVASVIGCVVLVVILGFLIMVLYTRTRKPRRSQVSIPKSRINNTDGKLQAQLEKAGYSMPVHVRTENPYSTLSVVNN